jgi:hypothetical protein
MKNLLFYRKKGNFIQTVLKWIDLDTYWYQIQQLHFLGLRKI